MAWIFASESEVGHQCASNVRVNTVRLGCLIYCSFVMLMMLRVFVISALRAGFKELVFAATEGRRHVSMATGWECQGTILRFAGNTPRLKRSIKDVSNSMFMAKHGAITNDTRVCKLLSRRCKKINPSNVDSCFVAVQRGGGYLDFMRIARSCGIISDRIGFILAPVLRGQTDVCLTVVEIPCDIQNLYAALIVRATSVNVRANFKGLRLSAVVCFKLFVSECFCD